MAKLASDDTDRVKRDIEHQIEERLHDAVSDLYRRLGEAVERVGERLCEDDEGKLLVFRDSMIENIRGLVDVVPRLNIFGDDTLGGLVATLLDLQGRNGNLIQCHRVSLCRHRFSPPPPYRNSKGCWFLSDVGREG